MPDEPVVPDGPGEQQPGPIVVPGPAIPPVVVPAENRLLRFSFRHLNTANAKFQVNDCTVEFFRELLARIRAYSTWTVDDFCDQNNNEHRHIIYFPETTEPNGFPVDGDPDQFTYHEAWQFELDRNEMWRVHGVIIDDTFYIVWLDPNHELYAANDREE